MYEVSVILPIYNSEKKIKKSIDSIVNQTFKQKFELIIINDGSTDNSEKICNDYVKKYDFIKYKKIKNSGVSIARNKGIEISEGKYIMFIDADDFFEEKMISMMVNSIKNENIGLVISGYRGVNELNGNKSTEKKCENKMYTKNDFDKLIQTTQKKFLFNQVWNKIYISKIIKENCIKFESKLSLGEDYKFNLKYLNYIENCLLIDSVLYNYTNSTEGLNFSYRADRMEINLKNIKELEKFYKKNNYPMEYVNNRFLITCLSGISNICKNQDKQERTHKLKDFKNNEKIRKKIKSTHYTGKFKVIKTLILIKSIYVLKILGFLLNYYDHIYKKIKLGY